MKPYLLTEMVGGAKMMSHCWGCAGNQVHSDSIFFNTMCNYLYYSKTVQNPARQIVVPFLKVPLYYTIILLGYQRQSIMVPEAINSLNAEIIYLSWFINGENQSYQSKVK